MKQSNLVTHLPSFKGCTECHGNLTLYRGMSITSLSCKGSISLSTKFCAVICYC